MKLSDIPIRLVKPLGESEDDRKARRYEYTKKWRQRNRERRNANDRAWRAKRKEA